MQATAHLFLREGDERMKQGSRPAGRYCTVNSLSDDQMTCVAGAFGS